uniref:(California timema) hypothetical protein n=1 Tax=Timema californicum TaxID=61474 RepID=A0A7R9PBZ4_TIMCA|nr:unnamed protein product [Timema californicum]
MSVFNVAGQIFLGLAAGSVLGIVTRPMRLVGILAAATIIVLVVTKPELMGGLPSFMQRYPYFSGCMMTAFIVAAINQQ